MKNIFFILFFFNFIIAYSNYSPDSSKKIISGWKFYDFKDSLISVDIDTIIDNFHTFPEYLKINPFYSSIANIGRGGISKDLEYINFFNDFFPINQYNNELFSNENCIFYNTKKQYSNINYNKGAKKEGAISILHTQNINSRLNIGVKYFVVSSNGNYKQQTTKSSQFSFFSSYNGLRYNSYFNLGYSKILISENGGIYNDSLFEDNILKPTFINVKLMYAKNKFKKFSLFYSHEYKFGKKIIEHLKDSTLDDTVKNLKYINHIASIEHIFEYNNYYKLYTDKQNGEFYNSSYKYIYDLESDSVNQVIDYNTQYFINKKETYDSIYYKSMRNTFLFKILDNKLLNSGLKLYIRNELRKNYIYDFDTIYSTNCVGFSLYKLNVKKFNWSIGSEYYIDGYNLSNILINTYERLNLTKNSCVEFKGNFKRLNPSFLENNYMSNHFKWDSTFLSKDETKYQLSYSNFKFKLQIGFKGYIYDNFIYFDEIGYPRQNTSTFNVYSLYLRKKIVFKNFVSVNKFIYQKNENSNILRIPDFLALTSNYYQFSMFNKVLKIQIGFEVNYNSEYYIYSYIPATAVFNLQNEKKIGNYPLMNVFLNLHLKRARFYIKLDHLNSGLMNRYYYSFLHYPTYGRTLKFGISWNFYD